MAKSKEAKQNEGGNGQLPAAATPDVAGVEWVEYIAYVGKSPEPGLYIRVSRLGEIYVSADAIALVPKGLKRVRFYRSLDNRWLKLVIGREILPGSLGLQGKPGSGHGMRVSSRRTMREWGYIREDRMQYPLCCLVGADASSTASETVTFVADMQAGVVRPQGQTGPTKKGRSDSPAGPQRIACPDCGRVVWCPECGKLVSLRASGRMWEHVDRDGEPCPRSGLMPTEPLPMAIEDDDEGDED